MASQAHSRRFKNGIYERTHSANSRLSDWNIRVVFINKIENPTSQDKPRMIFNYSQINKDMPGCHLKLAAKVYDYLSDPRHKVFIQTNIKYAYFSVNLYPNDRHIFTFIIPKIGQLQSTRIP